MKAILVDDERLALTFLENQLKKVSDFDIVNTYTFFDFEEEKEILNDLDVAFLDIEMPEKSGIQLAEQMLEINPQLTIVFVTAYDKYAVQAFDLHALDYILKPVRPERLKQTIERIVEKVQIEEVPRTNQEFIEVQVLNEFSIKENEIQWRTSRAQELFLYLLHHEGKTIPKAKLIELLWSDFEVERAYSQLYTTIYHIRKALSSLSNYFTLKNSQDGYVLETNNVKIDANEWEHLIVHAPTLNEQTLDWYENVMKNYKGTFLEAYDYLWAESERFRLEQIWLKYAKKLGEMYIKQEKFEDAIRWFAKISELRPDDEDACFILMKLYAKLQYGILVHHQYERLKASLEELNMEVSPQIEEWYHNFKK